MSDEESETAPVEEQMTSIQALLSRLETATEDEIRGPLRLGELAFEHEAVEALTEIREILQELQDEDLEYADPHLLEEAESEAGLILSILNQMLEISARTPDAENTRDELMRQLREKREYFRRTVKPNLKTALIRKHSGQREPGADANLLREIEQARQALQREFERNRDQLENLRPTLEAARDAAAVTSADDLGPLYTSQANDHRTAWKRSLKWSLVALFLSVVVGLAVVLIGHPTGKITDAEVAGRLLLDLFLIGLALYVLRMASLQFRVHRHLEVVNRNKAAALDVYRRMVASSDDPTTREALALTIAQAVFASEQSGFIDPSGDHITLVERVVASLPRASTPSS